ncbi:MAG: hypothetical protein IPL61_17615 [Myxococcales bacterium]|nr:hypothetical protein [Myxococcales bacterium]
MRIVPVLVAVVIATAADPARAAPTVDAVVVWAPGIDRAPIARAAQVAGVALIDRTPAPAPAPAIAATVTRAIEAFDGLRLDDAWAALEQARAEVDATGGGDLGPSALSDVFVYRALVRTERADLTGAWDEWITAAAIAPERTLDPARFAPRVVADHERARAAVRARGRVPLTLTEADGCTARLDGAPTPTPVEAIVGSHWLRVTCAGAEPWGRRVTITEATTTIAIAARPVRAPSDDELLVTARSVGAAGFVAVELRGSVAWVRRFGADGRERDHRTVAVADGGPAIAAAVAALVRPPAPARRWYQTRWAWAAGAAGVTAAIVVPLALLLAGGDAPSTATVAGPGADL